MERQALARLRQPGAQGSCVTEIKYNVTRFHCHLRTRSRALRDVLAQVPGGLSGPGSGRPPALRTAQRRQGPGVLLVRGREWSWFESGPGTSRGPRDVRVPAQAESERTSCVRVSACDVRRWLPARPGGRWVSGSTPVAPTV